MSVEWVKRLLRTAMHDLTCDFYGHGLWLSLSLCRLRYARPLPHSLRLPLVFCNNLWKKLQAKFHSPGLRNNGRAPRQLNLTLNIFIWKHSQPYCTRCSFFFALQNHTLVTAYTIGHERTNHLDFMVSHGSWWMHFVAGFGSWAWAWTCGCCLDVGVLSLHFDFSLICC